jgi:hypothetical protein
MVNSGSLASVVASKLLPDVVPAEVAPRSWAVANESLAGAAIAGPAGKARRTVEAIQTRVATLEGSPHRRHRRAAIVIAVQIQRFTAISPSCYFA